MLQRYRDGGLSDAIAFRLEDGLSWALGGESGTGSDRDATWRRGAPLAAPRGECRRSDFPRSNRFG